MKLSGVQDEQGYEIVTVDTERGKRMFVSGGSILGDVYGLYWVWDRLRVHKEIPTLNVKRIPHLKIRISGGLTEEALRNNLRYSVTWASDGNTLNFVPWDVEPERSKNEKNARELRQLVKYAHSLHQKYLATCDEITYHPSLLESFNAKLSPDDPALWDMLQEKYRRLFRAVPELDGVRIRTGELTRVFDDYESYDVMHDRAESGWTLDESYRMFLQKMHEVVVDELDKIYFHRTWATTANEQHSSAEAYAKIFTDEVPRKNLYLSPYLSLADRWYYQPYNPTFNVTPHSMVVLLSTLDYHAHAGVSIFPSFPGPYYKGGMDQILEPSDNNLRGSHYGAPKGKNFDTVNVTAYTAFRLSWNPNEDIRDIARDFASIHFGPKASEKMAEILMLSPIAYKDGIYIKPVAENIVGNTLLHLRLTTFPVHGMPDLDNGKVHIEWLHDTMYKPCEAKQEETLSYLGRGLRAAREMCRIYKEVDPLIEDRELARKTGDKLQLARLLVETNVLYVRTCLAYFDYRKTPTDANKTRLSEVSASLKETYVRFEATPNYVYLPFGIDQLLLSVDDALDDLELAEKKLAKALGADESAAAIVEQQNLHKLAVKKHAGTAKKFLHWEGLVDGRDILSIRGETVEIQHLRYDPIQGAKSDFLSPLPEREVTVILDDLESWPIHPFVLEQPSRENNYTLKVYLYAAPSGYGRFRLDFYYVDQKPEALGLQTPW